MDCFQYNLAEMFLYLECVWGGVLSHPLLLRFGPCGMYQISIAYSDEHNAYWYFLFKQLQDFELAQEKRASIDWIKEHIRREIEQHKDTFDNENIRDFIDLYLQMARENKNASEDGFSRK